MGQAKIIVDGYLYGTLYVGGAWIRNETSGMQYTFDGKGNCDMKKVDPMDDFAKVLAASPNVTLAQKTTLGAGSAALNIQVWDVEVPNVGVAGFVIQDDGTNVAPGLSSVPPLATLIPDPCVQLSAVGK